MMGREKFTALLNQLEGELKTLEITYEQYFMGVEKRSPEQQRQKFAGHLRKLMTMHITQTDLRFRIQSISGRFNSYVNHWDRIQRQIDEGRYERHTARIQRRASTQASPSSQTEDRPANQLDSLYQELVNAHQSCKMKTPNKEQVAKFLAKQEAAIKQRFGDKKVDFVVVTEAGKPKVKVRAKS